MATVAEAEHRPLTVMFCDLKGSTPLQEWLDRDDDTLAVMNEYYQVCNRIAKRYEGYVAQLQGDGVVVYFGYPVAHEDDAERAVRVGLDIVVALESLNVQLQRTVAAMQGRTLAVRIGIHTGKVIIGEVRKGDQVEPLALGRTLNIAARLQGKAKANTVVISVDTAEEKVQRRFQLQDRGFPKLKGVSTPIQMYRVVREREVPVKSRLTPLVDREHELGFLLERWEQVKEGRGQVVVLSGEPGIGKSRLVRAFQERIASDPHWWAESGGWRLFADSDFYAIKKLFQQIPGWQENASVEQKVARVKESLTAVGPAPQEVLPLVEWLLDPPVSVHDSHGSPSPDDPREKRFNQLAQWLFSIARLRPLVVVLEDLQWIDPSTGALLSFLAKQVPMAPVLFVCTARPEFQESQFQYVKPLLVSPLNNRHTREMITHVAEHTVLEEDQVRLVIEKANGNPFVVEEYSKYLMKHGTGKVPDTMQSLLMEQLDQSGKAGRTVAQAASVIGQEFSYVLLRAVSRLSEEELHVALGPLTDQAILYQQGLPPQAIYRFKHALVQETAYESLPKDTRHEYHKRIAQALESDFPETKETQPELLARHYTEAGLTKQAIPYWLDAGKRANRRQAFEEAETHLIRGLEVLKELPDTPARRHTEEEFQTELNLARLMSTGYASSTIIGSISPDSETALYQSALKWGVYLIQGNFPGAKECVNEIWQLEKSRYRERRWDLTAHAFQGAFEYYIGNLQHAQTYAEKALDLYTEEDAVLAFNPKVYPLVYLSLSAWQSGNVARALQFSKEALDWVEGVNRPHERAFTFHFACILRVCLHDYEKAGELAGALIEMSKDGKAPLYEATGKCMRGWALAQQGDYKEGMRQLTEGLKGRREMSNRLAQGLLYACWAEAEAKTGMFDSALNVVEEGLAETNDEEIYKIDLYRLKGDLLFKQATTMRVEGGGNNETLELLPQAERCYQKALALARRRGARFYELRARMGLARLWQKQGKKNKAHQELTEICEKFTEGFDTADLKEAKALLDD